jgi:hypothetical protein
MGTSLVTVFALTGAARAEQAAAVTAETFARPDGSSCYSVSLTPQAAKPAAGPSDVLVMFDTSASQAGDYREKALETLDVLLGALGSQDRVQLTAVDLQAIPLTKDFVAPRSSELQAAVASLRGRVPLGSTDMDTALESAAAKFASTEGTRNRAVVYIGDGMSTAQLIGTTRMQQLVDQFVKSHIAVSGYAIGPRIDAILLGALASDTGGVLAVDRQERFDPKDGKQIDAAIPARQFGLFLAGAATAPVAWPMSVKIDETLGETFPRHTPPLRFDRETVLLGVSKDIPAGAIEMSFELAGKNVPMRWDVTAAASDADRAYLSELITLATRDGGVGLPLVGVAGLRELRSMVNVQAQSMARLGQQAVATGNVEQARRLAGEALRLDANNPEAIAIAEAADRMSDAGPARSLKLVNFAVEGEPVEAPADIAVSDEGGLLREVERERAVRAGRLQAEIQASIYRARSMMGTDPETASNDLKLAMENVRSAPDLSDELRFQLNDQLQSALREASRQSQVKAERDIRAAAIASEAEARAQMNRELIDYQNKKAQLVERFNSLMDEHRYADAENVANTIRQDEQAVPPVNSSTQLVSQLTKSNTDAHYMNFATWRGFLAMHHSIQRSSIPLSDDPPVIYPDADVWRLLTERRQKYRSVDLARNNPAEVKIIKALDEPTELEFIETPLSDVVEYLKTRHNIEIQLDKKALEEAAIQPDTPISRNLKGVTLRSALRLMLREYDLTYVIRDEVLQITTRTAADLLLTTKVYPVADLVIPIKVTNPLQGGLGGSMGGGMGGAGGGMGGGMGGMGGGGGGFGGGGGGMFAVKDDLKISAKSIPAESKAAPVVTPQAVPAPQARAAGPAPAPKAIEISPPAGEGLQAAWDAHFASHEESPAAVRESVRRYMKAGQPDQVIAIINAALRHKQPQPWMYEALGLAMQASAAAPEEIERALMSAVDFNARSLDLMAVAEYLARSMPGNRPIELRALKLYRQVAALEPSRPEPLVAGMALAQRLNDLDGIQWSTVGVLSQAWPKNQQEIAQLASRVAIAAYEQLIAEGKKDEALKFKKALDEARVRDAVIVVSWTGEADIDLLVEEPSGAICSFRNPRTSGGGVMLGDETTAVDDSQSTGATTETYVLPQGFNGTYKMLLRRVWGKPSVDRVTVDYYVHRGSKNEKHLRKQISLDKGEASVAFELQNGRRNEALAEEQLANAVNGQLAVGKAILAQQLNQQLASATDTDTLGGFLGGNNRFGLRGAVGYQPVIITLPEGANFSATAVVSADRRYVRCTTVPFFSTIPKVNTFNYSAGSSGTSGT